MKTIPCFHCDAPVDFSAWLHPTCPKCGHWNAMISGTCRDCGHVQTALRDLARYHCNECGQDWHQGIHGVERISSSNANPFPAHCRERGEQSASSAPPQRLAGLTFDGEASFEDQET